MLKCLNKHDRIAIGILLKWFRNCCIGTAGAFLITSLPGQKWKSLDYILFDIKWYMILMGILAVLLVILFFILKLTDKNRPGDDSE